MSVIGSAAAKIVPIRRRIVSYHLTLIAPILEFIASPTSGMMTKLAFPYKRSPDLFDRDVVSLAIVQYIIDGLGPTKFYRRPGMYPLTSYVSVSFIGLLCIGEVTIATLSMLPYFNWEKNAMKFKTSYRT